MSYSERRHSKPSRHARIAVLTCLCCLWLPCWLAGRPSPQDSKSKVDIIGKTYPIKPTVPTADRRQPGKVFLERADKLMTDQRVDSGQILIGDVQFRKGDMMMFCDSAVFYDQSGSLEAYGHVRMEQGDTLYVYAHELNYDGQSELATFYGYATTPQVRLINKDVELTTKVFYYDLANNLGYYDSDGRITDAENELTSIYGQYSPDTKEAEFRIDVVLQDLKKEKFNMTTQELLYNTDSHIARIVSSSVIVTDSATVYSSNGWYDTEAGKSELYDRSLVVSKRGSTLTGDTLFYDTHEEFGEAFGNMVLTDTVRSVALEGNYGCYYQKLDSAFATNRARALEFSKADTLFMHGDTVRAYRLPGEDSMHVVTCHPRVRFWRVDLQGLCDSLSFQESDSILYMYRHPIVWSGDRQVFGNLIMVHFNDSTADWAELPDFGFVAEHIGEEFYNQLTGKKMHAIFDNGQLSQLDVDGNVESIILPQESDSTYNKMVRSESSFLKANFNDQKLERLAMWPEVTGKVTPLYLARKSQIYLNNFNWYDALRPKDKDDIFVIPPEMEALMNEAPTTTRHRRDL